MPKSGPDRRHGPRCSLLNSAIFAGNRSGAMSRLTCVEIEFRAPHAIDATLPPYLRLLDGVGTRRPRGPHKWKAAVTFLAKQGDNGIVWNILSYWRATH